MCIRDSATLDRSASGIASAIGARHRTPDDHFARCTLGQDVYKRQPVLEPLQ